MSETNQKADIFDLVDINGDLTLQRDFFRTTNNVNSPYKDSDLPIFKTIFKKDIKTLSLFLLNDANINLKNRSGLTPLMLAISIGFLEGINVLLVSDGDLNQQDSGNRNALIYAIIKSNIDIVNILIKFGIDVSACDNRGCNAIIYAARSNLNGSGKLKNYMINHEIVEEPSSEDIYSYYEALIIVLINKHIDINHSDQNGNNALYYAIRKSNNELVKVLLEYGANPNSTYDNEETALMIASNSNNEAAFKMLLSSNSTINDINKDSQNIEEIVKLKGQKELEDLITRVKGGEEFDDITFKVIGSKENEENSSFLVKGGTSEKDNSSVVVRGGANEEDNSKFIVKGGAQDNIITDEIQIISGSNTVNKIKNIRGAISNISETLSSSFLGNIAANDVCTEAEDDFHNPFDDLPEESSTFAELEEQIEIKKVNLQAKNLFADLIKHVDVIPENSNNDDDFHDPFALPEEEQILDQNDNEIKNGIDLDCDDLTISKSTIDEKNLERPKKEAEQEKTLKVNVDERLKQGRTRLMIASSNGDTSSVKSLLELKADPNKRDFAGRNALMYATIKGHLDIMKIIVSQKINLETKDNKATATLMYAIKANNLSAVNLLLEAGAKPDIRVKGTSTLMLAASKGQVETVEVLLNYGVDPVVKDFKGRNAAKYAQIAGYQKLYKSLLDQKRRNTSVKVT